MSQFRRWGRFRLIRTWRNHDDVSTLSHTRTSKEWELSAHSGVERGGEENWLARLRLISGKSRRLRWQNTDAPMSLMRAIKQSSRLFYNHSGTFSNPKWMILAPISSIGRSNLLRSRLPTQAKCFLALNTLMTLSRESFDIQWRILWISFQIIYSTRQEWTRTFHHDATAKSDCMSERVSQLAQGIVSSTNCKQSYADLK